MGRLIFTNANVIPGDAPAQRNATVTVNGERIEQVSTGRPVTPGVGDRVIDLAGRTLMPGMITCHVHLGYHLTGSKELPVGLEEPPVYQALLGARNMGLLLDCGFTGAVGAGNGFAMDASLKRAADNGLIRGPRLMAGSRNMGATGFSLHYSHPWYWHAKPVDIHIRDGADDFRKGVRQEINEGAEMIKLFATGGHLSITPAHTFEMSRDEIRAAIDAAHGHRAKIRAHASNAQAIIEAIEMGIDVIDHGDGLNPACIDALVSKGVFYAPSLRLPIEMAAKSWTYEPVALVQAETERMKKILPEVNKAGVKVILGDDYGVVTLDHGREAEELNFYVKEIGIPPLDVIRWATKHGAELMGRAHELGTVEQGKLADLLVVDGDPLTNMSVLNDKTNLLAILKGGVFMKDELDKLARVERGLSKSA
jgi:imidazolonepropionase-like amidohydrolase